MTMLDEILEKGLDHKAGCAILEWRFKAAIHGASVAGLKPECTCGADKRRKYLERLNRLDSEMLTAGSIAICGKDQQMYRDEAGDAFESMLDKAEEGL